MVGTQLPFPERLTFQHRCVYPAYLSWVQWQLEYGYIRLFGGRLSFDGLSLENDGENVSVN